MWHLVKDGEIKQQWETRVDLHVPAQGWEVPWGGAQPSLPHPAPQLTGRFLQTGGLAICRGVGGPVSTSQF